MPADFEEFVAAASPSLVRAAMLLTGSRADAEDLAQEALVAVSTHWGRVRDRGAARAYAGVTLGRMARRHLRRASVRRELPSAGVPERPYADRPVVTSRVVRAALLSLPVRQREAVVLRFYLDLSVESAARAMRCSPGTVKSQVSKALATLRTHPAFAGEEEASHG